MATTGRKSVNPEVGCAGLAGAFEGVALVTAFHTALYTMLSRPLRNSLLCYHLSTPVSGGAGTFEGVAHVTSLLDATLSRPLRHCLLRLVEALLLPAAAREDERAARAAAANAAAFVAAGGVQLAVDLVAGMHLAEEPGILVGGSVWMKTRMYVSEKGKLDCATWAAVADDTFFVAVAACSWALTETPLR